MNENDIQDLDLSADEAENVTGGYSVQPVTPLVPGAEATAGAEVASVKKTAKDALSPMSGGPSF